MPTISFRLGFPAAEPRLMLVIVGCLCPAGCRDLHCYQHTKKSEWFLLEPVVYSTRCRCRDVGAPKISLVNEVLVGLEWRGLIGQHTPAAHSQRLRAEMG